MIRRETAALAKHWPIVTAAMAGWALDAFDFTLLLFLIPHLKGVFAVGLPEMAFVVTATGLAKVVGTIGWGLAADRCGRKLPFMLSILWFSAFCGLSGLAWSYASFLAFRILFGLGFGGEWSTSAALLMETVPAELRGVASGLMMLGYEIGYLAAALAFRVVFPLFGWRWLLALGILPALLTLLVQTAVEESPVWLAGRERKRPRAALPLTPAVIQAWALMAFLNFMSWAIFALYPTFLITVRHLSPAGVFPYIAAYSVASIVGKPLADRGARRRHRHRLGHDQRQRRRPLADRDRCPALRARGRHGRLYRARGDRFGRDRRFRHRTLHPAVNGGVTADRLFRPFEIGDRRL